MKHLRPVSGQTNDSADSLSEDIDKAAFHYELSVDVLARTLWGEARGEGSAGMQAVANVVMNRAEKGGWWGDCVISVCQKDYQFSCWNKNDPNYKKLLAVDTRNVYFATALRIARRAVNDVLDDITSGADHYHAAGITPYWAKGEKPVAVIGNHIFYKLRI